MFRVRLLLPMLFAASATLAAMPNGPSPSDYDTVATLTPFLKDWNAMSWSTQVSKLTGEASLSTHYRVQSETEYDTNAVPVKLSWNGTSNNCTVTVKRSRDGVTVFSVTTNATEVLFNAAEIGRNYTWTVENGSDSATWHFFTEPDTPRIIRRDGLGGISNARDCGGWTTTAGKVVKQGMLYRSAAYDWYYDNPSVLYFWTNAVGIKTDLDLRTVEFINGVCQEYGDRDFSSALGSSVEIISPDRLSGSEFASYTGLFTTGGKKSLKCAFTNLLIASRYPVLFHCSQGRDRTGSLAFVLNGLLGVTLNDLYEDYAYTDFGKVEYYYEGTASGWITSLYNQLNTSYPNATHPTLQSKCEAFIKAVGVTSAQIEVFRNLMLEEPEAAAMAPPADPTPPSVSTLYIDACDKPASNAWNKVNFSATGIYIDLVDSTAATTPVWFQVTTAADAMNSVSANPPTGDAAAFAPASPTQCYGADTPSVAKVRGLDPASFYSFTFYASRINVSDNRDTRFRVVGENGGTNILAVANNTSHVAVVPLIRPTASGEITITIDKGPANTSGYYYFLAMKIVGIPMASMLDVDGSPSYYGTVVPPYGATNGLETGDSFLCSAPEMVDVAAGTRAVCVGWKLYKIDNETGAATLWLEGTSNECEYEHPGVQTRLVWQWNVDEPPVDPTEYGAADTTHCTYTWKGHTGPWAYTTNWTASAGATYGIPDNRLYATADFPASLAGAFTATVGLNTSVEYAYFNSPNLTLKLDNHSLSVEKAVRVGYNAYFFTPATNADSTLELAGSNAALILKNPAATRYYFGYTADATSATGEATIKFTVPAATWATAPLRVAGSDSKFYIGYNVKFVVDATALGVPAGGAPVTVPLVSTTDGIRACDGRPADYASAATVICASGAVGTVAISGDNLFLTVSRQAATFLLLH